MSKFRRMPPARVATPPPKRFTAYRVYYSWVDDDGALVRDTSVTDKATSELSARNSVPRVIAELPGFKVCGVEEVEGLQTWIGSCGISWFVSYKPDIRGGWVGAFPANDRAKVKP